MTSTYPAISDCAVTAAAMRAAAALIEESGAGRAVGHLHQRADHASRSASRAGEPAERAAQVARARPGRRHARLPARQPGQPPGARSRHAGRPAASR